MLVSRWTSTSAWRKSKEVTRIGPTNETYCGPNPNLILDIIVETPRPTDWRCSDMKRTHRASGHSERDMPRCIGGWNVENLVERGIYIYSSCKLSK